MGTSEIDIRHIRRAIELAWRGEGAVEPNPMVGCVIAIGEEVLAEGYHHQYGKAHAEADAIAKLPADCDISAGTMYVTLEPCCHHGKQPPCTEAILKTGIQRVVIAIEDPFPEVSGRGIAQLRDAGIHVEVGIQAARPAEQVEIQKEALDLLAPYLKLQRAGRPWVIAKWAMTLDGKIATATGDSQWISCEASRQIVHQIRGRVDAIMVGSGTAIADNPTLTARPPGAKTATRIVVDSEASIVDTLDVSNLAKTAGDIPVIVVVDQPPADRVERLKSCGIEVLRVEGDGYVARLGKLLDELGKRRMTNLLVEGGGGLLGQFMDAKQIDEVHVFVAPKLIGGDAAITPIAGSGIDEMVDCLSLGKLHCKQIDSDVYLHGRLKR